MKIGILTQTLHNNYGGLLQNYALQQVLIRAGHEPCTIDHSRTVKVCRLRKIYRKLKAYLKHWLYPHKYGKPAYVANEREEAIISQHTEYFINKYIRRTKTLNTHKEFLEIAKSGEFQAYIVGSDQCWRPRYNRSFLKEMFLSFAENQTSVKRIAYAASFGTDDWELAPEIMSECARLAQFFDLITVREDSGVKLCKDFLGIDAQLVLDPTLLLTKEDYMKIVEAEHEPNSPGNLFYYILDPSEEKSQFIDGVANKLGLTPFTVMPGIPSGYRTKRDIKNDIGRCTYPPVTNWLRAFMDSEVTIVDSFHGMVFSIIFNKPFWVIGNKRRGMSRFTSFLRLFDLSDRLVEIGQINEIDWNMPIDWNCINRIRVKLANKSFALLTTFLK